ncbi:MAG: YigZ family protein [Cognatishimia activa]
MKQILNVVTDRGSKYAVSGCPVESRADIDAALKDLKRNKKFAKATHNTWAAVLSDDTPLKGDDGESGAGLVIVRMLERAELTDHLIVVTRWYGGVKLGGDRFRRVQDCVAAYLDTLG